MHASIKMFPDIPLSMLVRLCCELECDTKRDERCETILNSSQQKRARGEQPGMFLQQWAQLW